eukprot:CAMPEP_0173106778 /NCGR_PEP_ID=MMETSP1102-20130122/41309_1 /TAXON_ID=49646 /ORGANISM="Geminigera sp., Strain Caron Lab Isolate" /LENGTH=76 /DNA_ID=CAMNT_0014004091 /DNA_START=339 /DNA_END=570 /DNA_ORIENTATION=+
MKTCSKQWPVEQLSWLDLKQDAASGRRGGCGGVRVALAMYRRHGSANVRMPSDRWVLVQTCGTLEADSRDIYISIT